MSRCESSVAVFVSACLLSRSAGLEESVIWGLEIVFLDFGQESLVADSEILGSPSFIPIGSFERFFYLFALDQSHCSMGNLRKRAGQINRLQSVRFVCTRT